MNNRIIKAHIMLIEDDENITKVVRYNLEKENYQTTIVSDGDDALPMIRTTKPDLIILDIMLPNISGISICTSLRNESDIAHIPVIMCSAKDKALDKVFGLTSGADDYITKPFSSIELLARIKAIFRRSKLFSTNDEISIQNIRLNISSNEVFVNEEALELTPVEFQLLYLMMLSPNIIFSRESLIQKVGNRNSDYLSTRTIDVHIAGLRNALAAVSYDMKNVIKTVRNRGYKFVPIHK